jgi:hypothetical protein
VLFSLLSSKYYLQVFRGVIQKVSVHTGNTDTGSRLWPFYIVRQAPEKAGVIKRVLAMLASRKIEAGRRRVTLSVVAIVDAMLGRFRKNLSKHSSRKWNRVFF